MDEQRWRARPIAAFVLRVVTSLIPIALSVGLSLWLTRTLPKPTSILQLAGWWVLVLGVSTVVMFVTDRLMRKATPLILLLQATTIFPDKAPSRFSTALRAGSSVKNLKAQLDDALRMDQEDLARASQVILMLATALNAHDRRTRGHAERVRAYCDLLGEEMGLEEIERGKLRWASLLHDIGKLKISTDVLNKPGALDDVEWEIIRQHPALGMELIAPMRDWLGEWGGAIGDHHERYDGTGYPHGKAGEDIALSGRIVTVADAYDVMTSVRAYKKPVSPADARKELVDNSGTQFDPKVVRSFLNIGLGKMRWVAGPLSWIAQLPMLRALHVVREISTGVAVTAGAGALTVGMIGTGIVSPNPAVAAAAEGEVPNVADRAIVLETDEQGSVEVLAGEFVLAGFTIVVEDPPDHGRSIPVDGFIAYQPSPGYVGTDQVGLRVDGPGGIAGRATVLITVVAPRAPPVAVDDRAETDEDTAVTIDVLANDRSSGAIANDTLRITATPDHGTAVVVNGGVRYTPEPGFSGTDGFGYSELRPRMWCMGGGNTPE